MAKKYLDDAGLSVIKEILDEDYTLTAGAGIEINEDNVVGLNGENISNPNLLVNSDFKINQRGLTEYTNSNDDYIFAVDRWAFKKGGGDSATITIADNGITVGPMTAMVQIMDSELINNITGKTLTLSVNIDGVIISGTFTWTDQTYFVIKETDSLRVAYSVTGKYIQIFNTSTTESKNVKWAKLEISSVATPFISPDHIAEKIKCGIPDDTSEYGYKAIVNADSVNGKTVAADVPADAKFTDTTYGNASATAAGLVSTDTQTFAGDKTFSGNVNVTENITATGNITGDKVYNAIWNADYAEGFDYEGTIPEPGQIVELCGDNKIRIATVESNMVIGVCSNTYWALAGCKLEEIEAKRKVAIGICGQVPIKIKGTVNFGDFIICCGDGVGEVCNTPKIGQVIGRAMESNSSPEIKNVNCIIQVH